MSVSYDIGNLVSQIITDCNQQEEDRCARITARVQHVRTIKQLAVLFVAWARKHNIPAERSVCWVEDRSTHESHLIFKDGWCIAEQEILNDEFAQGHTNRICFTDEAEVVGDFFDFSICGIKTGIAQIVADSGIIWDV